MTRRTARSILDRAEKAIAENTRLFMAGTHDYAEFSRRNVALHDAIRAAGQSGQFARRWRSAHPLAAR